MGQNAGLDAPDETIGRCRAEQLRGEMTCPDPEVQNCRDASSIDPGCISPKERDGDTAPDLEANLPTQ